MSEGLQTHVTVRIVNDVRVARQLRDAGFCPVEAAYGEESVVDELRMDHHGALSHLEPVSLRAFRDHHGARRHDPRFVVAGELDPDAAFAMAALAGLVPAADEPGGDRAQAIVEMIALVDTDPIGRDLTGEEGFAFLKLWSQLFRTHDEALAPAAVLAWGPLTRRAREPLAGLLAGSLDAEIERRRTAEREARALDVDVSDDRRVVLLDGPTVWGFDVWYGRDEQQPAESVGAWRHPVVMTRSEDGSVTVGCPNVTVAETLFGSGGLRGVFDTLEPSGWGGREAIGGSPRGVRLSLEETVAAARAIHRLLG